MNALVLDRPKTIYTKDKIKHLLKYPHLLGHLCGKTKLTLLHSYWIKYIWDTNTEKSLQAHRGSYKTTAILVIGSIRWLLLHPNDRIGIVRKTYTDAAEVIGAIKQIMQMPAIKELFRTVHGFFPRFITKREGKLSFNFKKTATPEGSLNAYGLDASLTGKHLDKIICDDFVTLRDRISKAERIKSDAVIREIRTNIIDQGKACSYIGTPWHKYDSWRLLPPAVRFDVRQCGILSEEDIQEKRKKTTPALYAANYLLKHIADENTLFVEPKYELWKYSNKNTKYALLDPAYKGDHTNGLTIFARHEDNKDLIRGIGFTYPGNVEDWYEKIIAICKKYKVKYLDVENNADKGFSARALKGNGFVVKDYHEDMEKHHKISSYLYKYWENILWCTNTEDEYMEQILDYEEGTEPDDCPDSAAALIKRHFDETKAGGNLYDL